MFGFRSPNIRIPELYLQDHKSVDIGILKGEVESHTLMQQIMVMMTWCCRQYMISGWTAINDILLNAGRAAIDSPKKNQADFPGRFPTPHQSLDTQSCSADSKFP